MNTSPLKFLSFEDFMKEIARADEKRREVRIPRREVEQLVPVEEDSIDVCVGPDRNNLALNGKLLDIHQSGMCFMALNHGLSEGDLIYIDTLMGKFRFSSDAMVRWALGTQVGVEFLDPSARDAAFLAELYTARLLNSMRDEARA